MSPILSHLAAATGGVLIALAVFSPLLHCQRRALAAAEHRATHDPLTGLANRAALTTYLRAVLVRGDQVGVILLDLDNFKIVNDTPGVGHAGGDALLRKVASLLATVPAPVRLVARLGGDEFVAVVHGDPDTIAAVAYHLRDLMAGAMFTIAGRRFSLDVSVGYASSRVGLSARALLHCADLAMYEAKKAGGNVAAYRLSTPEPEIAERPPRRCRDRRRQP